MCELNRRSVLEHISADDERPKYQQIAAALRLAILTGEFQVGDPIPPNRQLAEFFGVAPMTARQAVLSLQRDGVLTGRHGLGVYVCETAGWDRVLTVEEREAMAVGDQTPANISAIEFIVLEKERRRVRSLFNRLRHHRDVLSVVANCADCPTCARLAAAMLDRDEGDFEP